MSSSPNHQEDTSSMFVHEAMPSPSHQSALKSEELDKTGHNDEEFDVVEEFRERVNAIKDGADMVYNPLSESLPKLPAYHPSFLKAVEYCSELMESATLLLRNADYKDTRILQLYEKASNSKSFEYPRPRIVGLIGDSGVGKSSLINALLDTPDVALSGASGEACTNVITEYHQAKPSQNAPFTAEITLFEPSDIQRILLMHLGWYYSYVHRSVENMDQEAIDEMKAHGETAIETFQALFADRDEFSDEERTNEFLEQAQCASDPNILRIFSSWIRDSLSKSGGEGGIICRSAFATEELASEIERFVKPCRHVLDENDCHVPSLWPLVKQVRVFLHSPLLKRGLIIADLPGLSDSNKIRIATTTRYMRRCNFGVLVAPIARVQTDSMVQKRLDELHKLFKHRKALLCSKIDDVPAKQRPSDLDATPQATEEHERLMGAYDHVCKEKTRLTGLKKRAKANEKQVLTENIVELELDKKILFALMREGLILMRNEKVVAVMRKKYKNLTQDQAPLIVFAVSSSEYIKHKEGYELFEEIPVSVRTTGVPYVRFNLSKLPARSRLDALKHYSNGTVEDLIGSLCNWSQQSTVQRRIELQALVAKPGAVVRVEIGKFVAELKTILENCILQKCDNRQKTWIEHSVRSFKKLTEEWHSATFAAWCRHNGAYKTKSKPFVSWNTEIMGPVTRDLTIAWELFDDGVATAKEDCFTNLVGLVDSISEDLAAEQGISMEPMAPFLSSLASKKILLRKCLDDFSAKVDASSRDTKLNITLNDEDPNSFLLQAMLPLYDKCANVSGKNLHTQRSTLLNDAMSKGEPFACFRTKIKDTIEKKIDAHQVDLIKGMERVFGMTLDDFNSTFAVEEIPDPKRDELRSQVCQFVDHAQAIINGPLAIELATAMADSE